MTGNLAYDEATKTATFIPTSPLLSFMTYTVTVSGVKDLSGNTDRIPGHLVVQDARDLAPDHGE